MESIDTRRSVGNHERDEEVTVEDARLVEFDMMKQATHSKKPGFGPAEAYRLSELAVTGDDAALMQLKAAAMPRDRLAQYQLGLLYELGRAVPQCASVAAEWFRMSAQLGWPYASLSLADLYTSGVGVPQDQIAALWWCLGGAMHGYEDAEYRVGLMYARGQGSPQDLDAARLWLERASLKGHERAQQALKDLSAMRRSH